MDDNLKKLASQLATDQTEIDQRNKEVNAQTDKLEAVKSGMKKSADKIYVPEGFYIIAPKERDANEKIDLLEEFVFEGQKMLKDQGLDNFTVLITEAGRRWAQDPNATIDQFKPADQVKSE